MKKKLQCILLIDDDEPTNYLNKLTLKAAGCTETVQVAESGPEALKFLMSVTEGKHPKPNLIFLDINMPAMDGWEFLEEYRKLEQEMKGEIIVVMLTTSLNPGDAVRASNCPEVDEFRIKPLNGQGLNDILKKYFAGCF